VLTLHAAHSPGETRVVLLQDGVALEYYIHRPAAPDLYGAVYWARVTARVPSMAGAFVALPGAEGFLPDTEGEPTAHTGDHLAVRVSRAAMGHKGPRVTARLTAAERQLATSGPVRLLHPGPTPLEELCAAYPGAPVEEGPLPDHLQAEMDGLAEPEIELPGGMRASFVPTPALTAIDLDSAAATGARAAKPDAQFAANRAVLPELGRQIRLRNLSGAILIDLSGLPTRKRAALGADLAAALAPDRLGPRLAGFSALGFAEILRPRLRPPLHERLSGPHAQGLAAIGRVRAEAACNPGARFSLRAAPAVAAALEADVAALSALAHGMTYKLSVRSDPTLAAGAWLIEAAHG
jgi:Ribonuclease G/E